MSAGAAVAVDGLKLNVAFSITEPCHRQGFYKNYKSYETFFLYLSELNTL